MKVFISCSTCVSLERQMKWLALAMRTTQASGLPFWKASACLMLFLESALASESQLSLHGLDTAKMASTGALMKE